MRERMGRKKEKREKEKKRRDSNGIGTSIVVHFVEESTVVEVTRFKSVGKQLGGMVSSINDIPLVGGASTLIKLFTSKRSTLVVSRNLSIDLVTVSRKKRKKEERKERERKNGERVSLDFLLGGRW